MPGESLEDALGWNLGRYTLHGEIASGGMATVHIGRMRGTAGFSKMVAIKRLHGQFAKDPDFVTMFLEEARLAARVHHPNVVQPLDVIATDGEVFLVMEYIRGESLSKLQRALRKTGERVPLKVAGAIMVGVLHGLHAAHEAVDERGVPLGIVHRDVSPQNVLVGTDGVARVLDFGIAKAADRSYSTREGDLKGKLAYMAPEQLTAQTGLDRRTDIYAATIVLWELLTGRRLFESDYSSAILARARNSEIMPPSAYADVPPGVDQAVQRGLARSPDDRYATAREMAIALEICMPLATPSKVGEWVEVLAADSLAKRASRIQEIEAELPGPSARERAKELLSELAAAADGPIAQGKKEREGATRSWKAPKSGEGRTMDRGLTPVSHVSAAIVVDEPSYRRASSQGQGTIPGFAAPAPPPSVPGPTATPAYGVGAVADEGPTAPLAIGARASAPPPAPAPSGPTLGATAPLSVPTGAFPLAPHGRYPSTPPAAMGGSLPFAATVPGPITEPLDLVAAPPLSNRHFVPPAAPVGTFAQHVGPVSGFDPGAAVAVHGHRAPAAGARARKLGVLPLLIALVLAVGAFVFALPLLVKRAYVGAAAKRGVILQVDDVDVSLHRVRLFGCRMRFPDAPGVVARAAELDFPSKGGEPMRVVVHDLDVTADGTWPQVRDGVSRYLTAHPLQELATAKDPIGAIEVTKGHVVWAGALGAGTKLDLDEIAGSVARVPNHALGEDMKFLAGRVELGTAAGTLGPWRAAFTRAPDATTAVVQLAPPNAEPAELTFVERSDGGMLVGLAIPRCTLDRIGVPKALAGLGADEPLQLEGTLHLFEPTPSRLHVDAALALYGVKLAGATMPLDVRAGGAVDGDPTTGPLDVHDGLLTFGNLKGRINGKLALLQDAFRLEAAWKTAPRACDKVTVGDASVTKLEDLAWDPASFAALDKTIAAVAAASQTALAGELVLDSRDLAQTKLSARPTNKCAKLFP